MGKNRLKKKLQKNFQLGYQESFHQRQEDEVNEVDKILDGVESVQEAIRIQLDTYKDPRIRVALEAVIYMLDEVTTDYYEENDNDPNDWDIITKRNYDSKDDILTMLERVQERVANRNTQYRNDY